MFLNQRDPLSQKLNFTVAYVTRYYVPSVATFVMLKAIMLRPRNVHIAVKRLVGKVCSFVTFVSLMTHNTNHRRIRLVYEYSICHDVISFNDQSREVLPLCDLFKNRTVRFVRRKCIQIQ